MLSEAGLLLLCYCQHVQPAMCEGKDVYHAVCVDEPQIWRRPSTRRAVHCMQAGKARRRMPQCWRPPSDSNLTPWGHGGAMTEI